MGRVRDESLGLVIRLQLARPVPEVLTVSYAALHFSGHLQTLG